MKFLLIPVFAAIAFLSSCGNSGTAKSSSWEKFRARNDYQKTYDTYKDSAIDKTPRANTTVVINKSSQRIQLLDGEKVLLDAPCTTGKAGKRTPSGNFRVTEKIVTKRSTIFGRCYGSGGRVHGGDRRKSPFRCKRYVGAPLPYWQRLTGDGIGMHASKYVKRYPGSNGCIRIQPHNAKLIFSKTNKGTRVKIVN